MLKSSFKLFGIFHALKITSYIVHERRFIVTSSESIICFFTSPCMYHTNNFIFCIKTLVVFINYKNYKIFLPQKISCIQCFITLYGFICCTSLPPCTSSTFFVIKIFLWLLDLTKIKSHKIILSQIFCQSRQ